MSPARRPPFASLAAAALVVSAVGPAAAQAPRALILDGGEVYGGFVTRHSYGVEVRSEHGSVVLPPERIHVNAATLDAAFLQLRDEVDPADAAARADLAAWCLSHGLPLRSREELLAALELKPTRDDWRRALRRVETVIAAASARADRVAPASDAVPAAAPTTGLSAETMRAFTGRVEPILLTRCGNAGCHGRAGAGAFRLTNPSRSAATTRRNLAAALAFVGDGGPLTSPLLAVCVDRPDRRGRTPFRVRGGPASKSALTAWAARAAAERPDLAARVESAVRHASAETFGNPAEVAPPARPIRPDAFDPAEFNRRFAPAPGSPGASTAPAVTPAAPPPPSPDVPE